MLSSITPLGEGGKGNSWRTTAVAHVLGALVGGVLLGLALAVLATAASLISDGIRVWVVAGILIVAYVAERRGVMIPTIHRQVDENWLTEYRGWVYGGGFGVQLGMGVVTIITSWLTWVALALAILTGSPFAAVLVGAVFGVSRGLTVSATHSVSSFDDLAQLHLKISTRAQPVAMAGQLTMIGSAVVIVAVLALSQVVS